MSGPDVKPPTDVLSSGNVVPSIKEPIYILDIKIHDSLGGLFANLSLLELLSLVMTDKEHNILMPYVNHHWFQGYHDPNVTAIKNGYKKCVDGEASEQGPTKEMTFCFFRILDADQVKKKKENIDNEGGETLRDSEGDEQEKEGTQTDNEKFDDIYEKDVCRLYRSNGEEFKTDKKATMVYSEEINKVVGFLKELKHHCEQKSNTLETAREFVKKKGIFIAPTDGLHRLQVLNHLCAENNDKKKDEETFLEKFQKKAPFCTTFVSISREAFEEGT